LRGTHPVFFHRNNPFEILCEKLKFSIFPPKEKILLKFRPSCDNLKLSWTHSPWQIAIQVHSISWQAFVVKPLRPRFSNFPLIFLHFGGTHD